MIVDDDGMFRESLIQNLSDAGYVAIGFEDGPTALNHLAQASVPDIILLDWKMPGMTGIEVLRQLRSQRIEAPVVFLTVLSDQIYEEVMAQGWNPKRQAFVQHYGSDHLDAAVLLMPLVFFVSPTDPRMLKTLHAINASPSRGGLVSNSLVYRYDLRRTPDGLVGLDGTFNMCTFWLVEALARAGKVDHTKLDEARLMFEQMLGYANHLGLYAEETGPTGEALGNFPQAFTHLSLISAAFNLDRILGVSD